MTKCASSFGTLYARWEQKKNGYIWCAQDRPWILFNWKWVEYKRFYYSFLSCFASNRCIYSAAFTLLLLYSRYSCSCRSRSYGSFRHAALLPRWCARLFVAGTYTGHVTASWRWFRQVPQVPASCSTLPPQSPQSPWVSCCFLPPGVTQPPPPPQQRHLLQICFTIQYKVTLWKSTK